MGEAVHRFLELSTTSARCRRTGTSFLECENPDGLATTRLVEILADRDLRRLSRGAPDPRAVLRSLSELHRVCLPVATQDGLGLFPAAKLAEHV